MLKIETEMTIDDFETGLRDILRGEPLLSLPTRINANAVGSSASLIQLIVTWARSAPGSAALRLHATNPASAALRTFARTPWGLTALNMANRIQLVSGQPIERREALLPARSFVEAMHNGLLEELRSINKTTIPVMCLDNAELRRPRRLYDQGTGKVLDRTAFEDLAAASLRELRSQKDCLVTSEFLQAVGSLLHEAFQNTDEHAQADFLGNHYRRSVRGILFSYQYVKLSKFQEMAGTSAPLLDYFQAWKPAHEDAKHGQFFEISIFDSGSGLAQNWLGKRGEIERSIVESPIPIAREYAAVLECLRKGGTTKLRDTRGNGLYRVMQAVKRAGGFIRIRSGRLSLIKAFALEVGSRPSPDDTQVVDMRTGGVPERQLAWADGTVITVMLPMVLSV